ncbi:MAG: ComEC/Rec2 family competence protein [Anaerotignum sp.]
MMKKIALLLSLLLGATGCGGEMVVDAAKTPMQQAAAVDAALEVHFIDVGQADCALLVSDGHYMVIDGGNNDDAETIVAYLKNQGVQTLDAVVGTHPHEDHIGSLDTIINSFDVQAVYMPKIMHTSQTFEDVLDAIANKGLKIKAPNPGDTISFNGLPVEFFGPQQEYSDFNNNSIVLKVTAGETSFLFTGDAEETAEKDILRAGYDLQADVLKVGHHGSSTSTSDAFLQAVSPKYAVISVGTDNKYGHPEKVTLDKLKKIDAKVYRTDLQGTVVCTTDGKEVTFRGEQAEGGKTEAIGSVAESTEIYIGNKNSKKFHTEECSSLPAESNRVYLESREEAISLGYEPCGSCKP